LVGHGGNVRDATFVTMGAVSWRARAAWPPAQPSQLATPGRRLTADPLRSAMRSMVAATLQNRSGQL